MKLTKAESRIIDEVVRNNRLRRRGFVDTGTKWITGKWRRPFNKGSIKTLTEKNFVKILSDPAGTPGNLWVLEITTAGWDHIYRVR